MCPSITGRLNHRTRRVWLHLPVLQARPFPLDSRSTLFPLCPVLSKLKSDDRVSPYIYAIFPSIMASDGCNQIGNGYGPITTSFAPGELSTIDIGGQSTNVFNFADLPCPPSGIDLPPGATYAPLISPPPFIFDLDPAFSTCIPGYSQGVDPPTALPTGLGPQGPGSPGGGLPRRDPGARGHPRVESRAPQITPGPIHRNQLWR